MNELICTNPKNYKLTLDKKYVVVIDENDTVMIVNDNNKTVRYYKDLFQEVVEEEIIPEPEPEIIARTEQDLINSITYDSIATKFIGFNNEEIIINNVLSILHNSNDFSCGIKNIVHIDSQIELIHEIVSELEAEFEQDLPLLYKALILSYFKNYMRHNLNNGSNAGIYLMSTNVTNNEYMDEETFNIFDEISDFKSEPELNSNSNNQIKVWGFYKSSLI